MAPPLRRPRRPTGRPGYWGRSSVRYLVDWPAAIAGKPAPTVGLRFYSGLVATEDPCGSELARDGFVSGDDYFVGVHIRCCGNGGLWLRPYGARGGLPAGLVIGDVRLCGTWSTGRPPSRAGSLLQVLRAPAGEWLPVAPPSRASALP